MTAFSSWFKRNFKDNVDDGARYLFGMAYGIGAPSSIVWDYLEKTGDKNYNEETFLKAAKLILDEGEN